jgi:RNA polymerase sigma-70 factor (ECF subfamily)
MLSNEEKKLRSKDEDIHTIECILSGDTDMFEVLQNKYKLLIYSLMRKMVKDEDDIDDLVQETFIKAYRSLSNYNQDYAFSSWLYKIASNTSIDFLRKKRILVSISHSNTTEEEDEEYEIEDSSYLPDANIIDSERSAIIKNAINELHEKYRVIIQLRHDEDLDYVEIAERLGIPLGTVKVNLFRARKLLELSLRKYPDLFDLSKNK